MHFKGFCLLRFDIQNITIKPSAGGCLFDAALTALKTLISQPSLLLLLLYIAGSVAWRLCLAWGLGAAMQRHPPAKCQRPPAGQKGNESGEKGVEMVWERGLIAARGFGGLGYQAASPPCCSVDP